MGSCGCELASAVAFEQRTLRIVLGINAVMFLVELGAGWMAESTGLLADSLDMLADASVYGMALYATTRSLAHKVFAARLSGFSQVVLALLVLGEVVRRAIVGSEPLSLIMISVACVAMVANVTCLLLIAKHRHGGIHMRASWIFSANDVLANMGVAFSGVLVHVLQTRWPDLILGSLLALVVLWGGLKILREARAAHEAECCEHRAPGPSLNN